MTDRASYSIEGGTADADRLARQATVMASSTMRFLAAAGLREGASCLDVGCGDGQVTIDMARAVGSSGRAVGVDVDAAALDIARRAARDAGVDVTFVHADVTRTALPGPDADLAFARLVLSHLVDPMATVRAMAAAVRPGGVVAVEDIYTPSLHADPPVPALDEVIDVYAATIRYHGGDPTIGPRLGAHLGAAGLVEIEEQTVDNRMTTVTQKMFLAELLDNMQESIRQAGTASPARLAEIRTAVAAAAQREDTVFVQARMHQVRGRRPGQ